MAFGFIDFAKEVLEASDRPLSVEKMWAAGCKRGLDGKLGSITKFPRGRKAARTGGCTLILSGYIFHLILIRIIH